MSWTQVGPNLLKNWATVLTVVALVLLAYAVAVGLLRRAFSIARRRQEGHEGNERALAYLKDLETWLLRALLVVVLIALVVGVLWAGNLLESDFVTKTLPDVRVKALRIIFILFLAFLARRALAFLVGQFGAYLLRKGDRSRDEEVRLKTLSDVVQGGGSVVIAVVTVFLILETVLESVGTVLASVGFLGIAFGFGAQSLVRDLISGFFILLENQLAVGDGVRLNDLWGTVERIGLRSTTLRDSEGIVHYIPNGSITRVSNATKGWSRAVVYAGTDYTTDPAKVLEVLRGVAAEAGADTALAPLLLGPLVVSGPEAFDDSMHYRIAGPTAPTRQWEVMRELRHRVWSAFAREGIALKKAPTYTAAGKVE